MKRILIGAALLAFLAITTPMAEASHRFPRARATGRFVYRTVTFRWVGGRCTATPQALPYTTTTTGDVSPPPPPT